MAYIFISVVQGLCLYLLGGSRGSRQQTYRNLILVFILTGFWHGANWTFICWGAFHGAFMLMERGRFGRWLPTTSKFIQHGYLLLVIGLSWVVFRSESLNYAMDYYGHLLGLGSSSDFQLDISSRLGI